MSEWFNIIGHWELQLKKEEVNYLRKKSKEELQNKATLMILANSFGITLCGVGFNKVQWENFQFAKEIHLNSKTILNIENSYIYCIVISKREFHIIVGHKVIAYNSSRCLKENDILNIQFIHANQHFHLY